MTSEGSFLTEEMRQKAIGIETKPRDLEVEKGAIKRFAESIGDPNPLWNDEAAARRSRYGGLIAPPTFLRSAGITRPPLPFETPYERRLDGGSEWEYFEPLRVGDRITIVARILDVSERAGKIGTMLFTVAEVTYTNQFDQLVAIQRNTGIAY